MSAGGGGGEVRWIDDRRLHVAGADFYCDHDLRDVPPGHLPVMKPRPVVEEYAALAAELQGGRIVELGIHRGGSTALLAALFRPDRLLAVDLSPEPVAELADHLTRHDLDRVVRPHYGVDQGDRTHLEALVEAELGEQPIDLVFDDASHLYDPTVASFEVLFPRLRPGGRYVIEDWRWEDQVRAEMRRIRAEGGPAAARLQVQIDAEVEARGGDPGPPRTRPLSRLALQLVLGRAASDAIAGLTIGSAWVVATRGPGALEPGFRLSDLCFDSFRQLAPLPEG